MKVDELLASQPFEWMFHHEFCEAAYRQFSSYAYVLGAMQFSSVDGNGISFVGRFLGQTEFEAGPHGATSGTFRLELPDGLNSKDASGILDRATLAIHIETAPIPVAPEASIAS